MYTYKSKIVDIQSLKITFMDLFKGRSYLTDNRRNIKVHLSSSSDSGVALF